MRNELDTLDKKVTELVLLNINLRKLNKKLQKDLTEKNSECQRLQQKIALSITSLKEIRKNEQMIGNYDYNIFNKSPDFRKMSKIIRSFKLTRDVKKNEVLIFCFLPIVSSLSS